MTTTFRIAVIAASVFCLSACTATPPKKDSQFSTSKDNKPTPVNNLGIKIRSGGEPRKGYYVFFENKNGQWRISSVGESRPNVTDYSAQEVLVFSPDLDYVQPDYRTSIYNKGRDVFRCWTGALRTRKDNAMTDYNPCESSLTKMVSFDTGSQILLTAVTFGAYSLTGTSSRTVGIDELQVAKLISDTEALKAVRKEKERLDNEKFIRRYHLDFNSAKTSDQFKYFAKKYGYNDPEQLVPVALQKAAELAENEETVRKRNAEIAENRRILEQKRIKEVRQQVVIFRKNIRVGVETNCGPVLESKSNLIKIYSPVSGYGNEHWLRINEIYPPGYNCQFYNGRYIPPVL